MNKIATLLRESRLARFLIPGGIILIVAGVIFFNAIQKTQNYKETQSVITKVELEEEAYTDANGDHHDAVYTVYVKYTVDGKEYESDLAGMPELTVGDTMRIFYDPDDPNNITQTKSMAIPIVMLALGAAALVGGIISGVNGLKRIKKMNEQEKEWING